MRRTTMNLWSTSAMAVALIAAPAAAQTTDPAAPVDPTVEAQEQPADPEAGAAQTDDETIVVTGLRRSLRSAQNIKRNSEQIVDAIVAEDIGKLPDITVSDTAARIPGIQVERQGGEASRVLLRGLDRSYYTTTYNGREIFTAETRSVALQDFPAGAISAVEAFKTSTANLVEPGLAGLINVRSRRPFDFSGFEIAGSVWANYPKQSRDLKPNAQLLITNRWETGNGGDIGALINFSYTRMHYQDSIRRHAFFIADLAGGRSPDWPEIHYAEADRWRPSINGALQWRPSPDLELYAEGLWQGYREESTDRMWQVPLWGGSAYSNIVIENGQVISGTVTNPGSCCNDTYQTQGFQGATKRHTDTYQFAVGGRYDAGPLRITGDIARTDSTFKLRAESVDFGIRNENFTVNWFTGRPGGDGPTLEIVGLDFANPANYNYRGFFERYLVAEGDDWQARLDGEYESGLGWLPTIQAGVRYTDRDAGRTDGERYWDANRIVPPNAFNILISEVPLDYSLFRSAFRGDDNRPTPSTWLAPTFKSVWSNIEALRQFNVSRGIPLDGNLNRSQNNDANPPAPVPTRNFNINEKTLAGYAQIKFDFEGSMPVDGILGVRVVRTDDRIQGFQRVPNTATPNPNDVLFEPLSIENDYTNWLPNLNVNLHLSDQWKLRFAATKTITRPLFEQLNPGFALGTPNCFDPANPQCEIAGSGGNPFLTPLRSNNWDASLEYYFSQNGFLSLAVFRRDMRGFIVNRRFEVPERDEATGLPIRISGPVNTNEGRIQGLEAQISTFFDWEFMPEWARAFGVQANATYINANIDFPLFCPGDVNPCVPGPGHGNATVVRTRIPDVSKMTYNLVGMYERGPLTARLSYNHRTKYPEGTLDPRDGFYTLQGRGRGSGRLDWSSSFNVNDNFTLFFDWTNILNIPFRSDIVRVNYANGEPTTREIFPMVVRYNESVMSGGIRFRFGGGAPRAAEAPPPELPPPPPEPVVVPPPVVEPPPPPPPPPEPSGQRG
jgi:TonB-dependent receptor